MVNKVTQWVVPWPEKHNKIKLQIKTNKQTQKKSSLTGGKQVPFDYRYKTSTYLCGIKLRSHGGQNIM